MHKLFTALFFIVLFQLSAQTSSPKLINYQGIARDAAGTPITSAFDIQFTIKNPTATVHNEFQNGIQPNSLGLFNTLIGKSPNTLTVSAWDNGPFTLDVLINTGSSFTLVGSQPLVSVPFSLFAGNVPSSYTNNILTIGANSYNIGTSSFSTPTITGTGLATVTPTIGPLYSINVPTPSLSYNNIGNVLTLTQGPITSSVPLTGVGSSTVSIVGLGNAIVTPTFGSAFTVSVAPQVITNSLNIISLSNGGGNVVVPMTTISPSTGIGVLGSALNGYTITNLASAPISYTAGQNISLSGNFISTPTNSLNFSNPTNGILTNGLNNSAFTIPSPTIGFGPGINITGAWPTPTIAVINGTNIPWGTFGNAGTNATTNFLGTTDGIDLVFRTNNTQRAVIQAASGNIGIGTGAPTAKLDVSGVGINLINGTTTGTGIGLNISSVSGNAIIGTNNSNTLGAIQGNNQGTSFSIYGSKTAAQTGEVARFENLNSANTSDALKGITSGLGYGLSAVNLNAATTSYAGYFEGGLISKGKNNLNSGYSILAKNQVNTDIFVVRNDGRVGIGTNTPINPLHVNGAVSITDGTQGLGNVLTSDAAGNASWQPVSTFSVFPFSSTSMATVSATPVQLGTFATYSKINADTKLEVIVQTHLVVSDLVGVNAVKYEVRVNGVLPPAGTGRTNYFLDNNGTFGPPQYTPATIIAEFSGIPAGPCNVQIWVYTVNPGTANGVSVDLGNYSASSVIVKEYR